MKTLNLTYVGRLAELAAGRAWSTIPLRGATLQQALRAVENPAAGVGAVLKPLRVNAAKSVPDIVAQRQRLSQALSRAAVRNTGANAARHQALMKRGSVIRAVDDYVLPHANPLLGSRFREMQAVMRTPVRFFAKADPSDPKRLVQLRGPAPAKRQKPEPESWISRNKWKLAGAGAMLTGIGVMSTLRDKGMKMPLNPHQSVGQELVGIKSQAAKDYEASMRAAAKKTIRADKKVSTAAAAAIQPEPATPKAAAAAAPKQPAAVKRTLTNPEVIQRATDKAWTNYKAGKLSGPKVLRVYQKFWGADVTKGTSIPDTFTGKSGSVLRGRARSLAIDKLKKGWGPVAPMPKGQGSLALAAVARMPIVFFNSADPDQFNQYAPTLYAGSMYRKGRRALTWVKRSGNIAQDAADTAAGKAPEPGKKREWEKSWFKNAVAGAAVGAGLYGTPRLYASLVGRKTGGRIRPNPTWGGLISSARAGEAKNLLPQKKLEAVMRTPVQLSDWRLADMRGNSARVFSPKAKTRDRREKTDWEKVSTIRAVRNGAIAAAVGLGGLSAYLGVKNAKLRKAAVAPVAQQPGSLTRDFFRKAAVGGQG